MSRNQTILAGLLGVQILLLLLTGGPLATSSAPVEAQPLFPQLESFTPAKLEILGSEDEKITLVREGEGWAIEEAGGYPATADKLDQLLDKLGDLEVRRPVVTSGRYHRALKVTDDDRERRVRIWKEASGSAEIDFYLGSSPNYQRIHLRRSGEDAVYEVQGIGSYDVQARAQSWFDAAFMSVGLEKVQSFTLENASGSFELARDDAGSWTVASPASAAGTALDKTKVDSLVRRVASLRAAEPAGRRDDAVHGLAAPRATVTLRYTEDAGESGEEETHTVSLWVGGAPSDDDTRAFVARSGFDFVVETYKTSVDSLVEQKLADLGAAPPEPDPET